MDPYQVLQVDPRADHDVIRAAYRVLARRHHPDLGGNAVRMALVNDAWAILGDPAARRRHDRAAARRALAEAQAQAQAHAQASWSATPEARPTAPVSHRPAAEASGYASATTSPQSRSSAHDASAPAVTAPAEPARRPEGSGTVLDFGRYTGWSIGELSRHDPNYLLWLERVPAGRGLRAEIERAMGVGREPVATMARPTRAERSRRSWFR
jgi:curved DNA-binding protein CbpA